MTGLTEGRMAPAAAEMRRCEGVNCSEQFSTTSSQRRFCTSGCAKQKKRVVKQCPVCGSQFTPQRATTRQQFCGVACASWGQKRKGPEGPRAPRLKNFRDEPCQYCGNLFKTASANHKYCSDPCRADAGRVRASSRVRQVFSQKAQTRQVWNAHRDDQISAQDGRCAICLETFENTDSRDVHQDHCHSTGKLRGVLCRSCNLAVGLLNDDPDSMNRAAQYLTSWRDS